MRKLVFLCSQLSDSLLTKRVMFLSVSTSVKHNRFLADSTFYRQNKNATKVHLKGDRNVTVQGLVQPGCLRKYKSNTHRGRKGVLYRHREDGFILRVPIFGFDLDFFSRDVPDLVKQISSRGC